MHTILEQKVSRSSGPAQLFAPRVGHASQPSYPPLKTYHSQGQYQKAKPTKRDRVFTHLAEPTTELLLKLLNANLVTRMQL